MGPTALRSKPTVHNGALHNVYKSQRSDRSRHDDGRRSPVSPIESNGETWKYPPRAQAHLKGLGPLHDKPHGEAPKDHFRSRPMSYYDGLPASPEPDNKAVFADLPAAPAKQRLSRPFEQPYPTSNQGRQAPGKGQTSTPSAAVPMHANLSRADSRLRRQPAGFSHPKAPAPLAIPPPAHQSKRQREPSPYRADQAPAQRSVRHQGKPVSGRRPARHQGWNPLQEPARQKGTVYVQRKDQRRGDDLERQGGLARSKSRAKDNDPEYKSGRRCFFSLMVMMIIVIVVVVVMVEKNKSRG